MNSQILKREFELLVVELGSHKSKDKHFTFTLDKNMFDVEAEPSRILSNTVIKDKRTEYNMSFTNPRMMSVTRPSLQTPRDIASKQDRTAKILALIKDKKDLSIKDVSIAFTDCSEKTIQRELNTLVSKGHIRKVGSKRWSRYLSL
jgi:predicted HTH transcriptional regulator